MYNEFYIVNTFKDGNYMSLGYGGWSFIEIQDEQMFYIT